MDARLDPVFVAVRQRVIDAGGGMVIIRDDPGDMVMKTPWNEPGKKEPAWFAAVQIKKSYVSCHLMPLYALPALRDDIAPGLLKRMQGKSCFNFKAVEPALLDDLERLVGRCAAAYAHPVGAQPH